MNYTKVGDIALLYIPEELDSQEYEIARAIYERENSISVVLRKLGRYGEFRKEKVKILIGERTDTVYREFGITIHIDLREAYFSEREKTERQRLKNLVNDSERILVLFAGVGIIPLVLTKDSQVEVTAVEKNEKAFILMKENIEQNALKGIIHPILKDVYAFKGGEFDRVIVPQPYRCNSFEWVKSYVKKKGFLHYYTWISTKQVLKPFPGFEITRRKRLFSYAPGVWKVCFDMQSVK
ncbi:MAG: methyltransferase [Theionarchaea archaeon]|nr:methyltransferase [Theionarchaea archaeon]